MANLPIFACYKGIILYDQYSLTFPFGLLIKQAKALELCIHKRTAIEL
jgi:hypothetical protein